MRLKLTMPAPAGLIVCLSAMQAWAFPGPDVIVGDLPTSIAYGQSGAINAYSIATTSCNIGDTPLDWYDFGTATPTLHPVINQAMYRSKVVDGSRRFEMIGQAWLKHGFCALQGTVCGGPCTPFCGGCCDELGVGCSDPYNAARNGDANGMGPKSQINAATGTIMVWPYPTSPSADPQRSRLQVLTSDIDPALNAGAAYYIEGQYVTQDDAAAGNDNNNCSYRRISVTNNPPFYSLTMVSSTVRMNQAIRAWRALDPLVTIVDVDIPSDGRVSVAYRVTLLPTGLYHYEYAIHNMNSHRCVATVSVPVTDPCAGIVNIGFHDVPYHSGDGFSVGTDYDGTDWPGTYAGGAVSWSMVGGTSEGLNPNGNALRWGTSYNYRFDSALPPAAGTMTLGLYRSGSPDSVTATVLVPGSVTCVPGDVNGDLVVDGGDIGRFSALLVLGGWAPTERCAGDLEATPDCQIDYDDVPNFANCVVAGGCP